MTALVEPRAAPLLRPARPSQAWLLPTMLLLPCLAWITFFFLAPLILMCWRSLASEGFSLETYSVLFTSPLFTKVMITTVKTAGVATVFALLLAYPLAYMLINTWSRTDFPKNSPRQDPELFAPLNLIVRPVVGAIA